MVLPDRAQQSAHMGVDALSVPDLVGNQLCMVLILDPLFKLEPDFGHWGKRRISKGSAGLECIWKGIYMCPVLFSYFALVEEKLCLLQGSTFSPLRIQYLSNIGT